ncbi:MAG: RnfABCDGE type electron transport complex subunit D, partial [Acutalibacteraceae bacterium]
MNRLVVSSSPHISSPDTVRGIMFDVILALLPAGVAAVWLFGLHALLLILTCVVSCVLAEYITRKIMKRDNTIGDLSAVVTGLLLAYNLPPSLPLWMAVIGCVAAIVVAKQLFGGIGQNFVNPALIGRIVLMNSFTTAMTT